jgi:hypothetical protein
VGGGAAVGSAIVVVGGAGAGLYAAHRTRRAVFGRAREEDQVSEAEQRILAAITALKCAIVDATAEGRRISCEEMTLFARLGIDPLARELESAFAEGLFDDLTSYHRIRLRGQLHALRRLRTRLETSE